MKFQTGDEVVITGVSTPGCKEFQEWANTCRAKGTPLVVTVVDNMLWFRDVDWCLYPRDVEKYHSIVENE